MNFRICSTHTTLPHDSMFLSRGTLLEFPTELQTELKCDAVSFQKGVMHTEVRPLTKGPAYSTVSGMCIFYHNKLNATCRFHFTSEHLQLPHLTTCITRVFDLVWDDENGFTSYLARIECQIKLRTIQWRFFVKDDVEYVAIPHTQVPTLTPFVKERLTALRSHFHHTVLIDAVSYRCLLIPSALVNTTPLPSHLSTGLWVLTPPYSRPRKVTTVAEQTSHLTHADSP